MNLQEWKAKGTFVKINDHEIFYVDEGDHDEVLVILHGFPSCSFDYWKVLPELIKKHRVIIHDELGFGLSDKPSDNQYLLSYQAEIAVKLWQALGVKKAHVLGHDYGTSILTDIICRDMNGSLDFEITSYTVCNGSMLIHMAQLLFAQKMLKHDTFGPLLAKLVNRPYFKWNMKKLWFDKSKYDPKEMDVLYDFFLFKNGRKVLPLIAKYVEQRYAHYEKWITNGLLKTNKPINILWGDKDPIAVIKMAHYINENARNPNLKILTDVGHYPMLEAPKKWSEGIMTLLAKTK